jgi:hypothetical protein
MKHISQIDAKLILAQDKHIHYLVDYVYDFLHETTSTKRLVMLL